MTDDSRHPVILSTDGPADPHYLLEVVEAFAEAARVMNHLTLHHSALEYPSEADRLIREVSTAASRLPQLLSQAGGWLGREQAAGRITVPAGEFWSNPAAAVSMARLRLEMASAIAAALQEALDDAASITCHLAVAEASPEVQDGTPLE
jgi:hypothetical protein